MTHAQRTASNNLKFARREIGETKSTHADEADAPRPSFTTMIRRIFRRGQQRPKSWPGRPEPVPVPVPVAEAKPTTASATVEISDSLSRSAPSAIPTPRRAQVQLIPKRRRASDDGRSEAEWRHRQAYCTNCDRLFFTSLSSLSNGEGRFCSLDCKTNFEYVTSLQEVMDTQLLGLSAASSIPVWAIADDSSMQSCVS